MTNIMVVEDNTILRGLLRDWLSAELAGCRVLEAASGEEALERGGAIPISVALMDIGLPGMSGLEAARILIARDPGLRVVILSIHDEERYRQEAAAAGVHAYVPKQNIYTGLLPVVRKFLSPDKYSTVVADKNKRSAF